MTGLQIQSIEIPETELVLQFVRSGGAGGQNVNKVSTKAVLFFNVVESTHIPEDIKTRFLSRWKNRISANGEVVLTSDRTRSQTQNTEDVIEKLKHMIEAVLTPPKSRRKTRPTKGSVERRLKEKKQRTQSVRNRQIDF